MNKLLSLLSLIALAAALIGCETNPAANRRDTVFHPAEESPRSASQGSSRYGHNGTHSPRTERKRTTSRSSRNRNTASDNSRSTRRRSSDSNGIVKPHDLDPEPTRSEEPEIVMSKTTQKLEAPDLTPAPAPPSNGSAPYAEAVPGKTGLVYSPFVASKKDGLVNVTDVNNVPLPPGTEVTDPHTGKTFSVP